MKALQDLAGRIHRADSLETLVDSILRGLDESFGFKHSMILVPAEETGVLVTIATRGYPENGAGAEVRFGEGIGGMVAEARKPIRISGLMRGMLYAFAMHKEAAEPAAGLRPRAAFPLPGLANPESQLGVPLLVRGELVGVLCLESEVPYRFHEEDKASIELLGSYLAIAIQNMQLQERSADAAAETRRDAGAGPPAAASRRRAAREPRAPRRRLLRRRRVHPARRRVPDPQPAGEDPLAAARPRARRTGRQEFTNRELRLDKSLNLPEWKDNLESRLLLLRRRLEQKSPDIRLVPRARGRFALELGCDVTLSVRP